MNADVRPSGSAGFSLVEVVIALVILAVGLLGLAAAMGYVSRQVHAADFLTERTVAQQNAIERVRGIPFNDLQSRAYDNAWTVGRYKLWWDAMQVNPNLHRVILYSEGPAQRAPEGRVEDARDTTVFSVVRGYNR